MNLRLAPRPDMPSLTTRYAASGSASIPELLPAAQAQQVWQELHAADSWTEIFRAGDKVYEMPAAAFAALGETTKAELQARIEEAARHGLQYRYRSIRVSEAPAIRTKRGLMIDRFADLMNQPATLDILRAITGRQEIAFADAQGTDYRAGDFLTSHDDDTTGKHRVAAYVFSLTSHWQADWGGLLMFEDGKSVSGFVPDFNVLRLFTVPRRHHVSIVAPWVEERRLSITGWLRSEAPVDHSGS